jgi:hypothetical protein
MTTAYPLHWPDTIPRARHREAGSFKTSLAGALKNVQDSLRKFGTDSGKPLANVVLSSNCSLGVEKPQDPGVAAWFTWDGEQFCIPVDRYLTPAANLQAIHHILEARRVELRHGTLALVRATFSGFRALPAPAGQKKRTWREVMNFGEEHPPLTMPQVKERYRQLASARHPDKNGGSHERMTELNNALTEAEKELKP